MKMKIFGESGGGGTGDKTMKISQRQLKKTRKFSTAYNEIIR